MSEITPEQTLETVLFGEEETRLAVSGSLQFIEEFDHGLIPINAEYNPARKLLTNKDKIGRFIEKRIKKSHKVQIPRRLFTSQNSDLEVNYSFADILIRDGYTIDEPKDWQERTDGNPGLHFLEIIFKNSFMYKDSYEREEWYRKRDYDVVKHYHPELPDYQPSDPRLRFVFKEVIWGDHIDPRPFDERNIQTDDTIGIHNYFDYKRFLLSFPKVHRIFGDSSYYNASKTVESLQRLAFENVIELASGESAVIDQLHDFYQGYVISGPQIHRRINDSCLDTQYWQNLSWMDHEELAKELEWEAESLRISRGE